MGRRTYRLKFISLFEADLAEIVDYISNSLYNEEAAISFVNDVEKAIMKRVECAESFEPYISNRDRTLRYYRIYVKRYAIYYVVYDDVMEIRRILHDSRDTDKYLQ